MTIRIAYADWFEKSIFHSDCDPKLNSNWINLLNFDLEKLDTWNDSKSNYKKCPAFVNYVDQTWVLKSAIDIELKWDPIKKTIESNLMPGSHELFIKMHEGDFNPYTARPIVAINNCIVFLSDCDIWVDCIPPFNHIDNSWRLLPASFNIYNWQRPVVPTFEMMKDEVKIKRGQPLIYFKFRSNNQKDMFQLEKIPLTENIEKLVMTCSSVKFFQKNISWKIVTGLIPNKFRPKKILK